MPNLDATSSIPIDDSEPAITPAAGLGMIVALMATIVVAAMIVRIGWLASPAADQDSTGENTKSDSPRNGVLARLKAGNVDIQTAMTTLNFSLQPDESLDARLPARAFEGEFMVTFDPGNVRRARIGAIVQGGSVIIHREDELIASDAAGDETRTVLPIASVALARRAQQFRYSFNANGKHPMRLQAIWQPDGSPQPLLLISNESIGK